ncbi:serine hydrolase domain-containing protein [Lysinibacillus yapensis]|uniref:serine hydrolase domain-containing protein n=1 Tax=Ureibacillus yapensis TaxID=2304605 RepID=UPI001314DC94|nr:serine hydrolase domain-containing protein [Lysinibacillus yapensis]
MINTETEKLIKRELDQAKKASIVLGVIKKDEKFTSGTIYDDMGKTEIGDCVFEIGSTTKTFTSLLLSKLVLNNTIALDEPVSTFKPEYKNALSYNGKEVTFRHLSTHRSRLPREDMKKIRQRLKEHKEDKDNPYKYFSHDDLHQFFMDLDLKKEVDQKWGYSNVGVGLLGNLLAEILGTTYEEAIRAEILNPLGMNDTFINGSPEQYERYIKSYNKKGNRIPPIELPAIHAAGALKSTMNDMLLYLEHQMGLKEEPFKEEIELCHRVHAKTRSKKLNMGLGWFIEQKKWIDSPIIHHGGTTIGFHTYCGFIKEKQVGIVICSTIQLKPMRIIKMLTNLTGMVNEDIAESIYKNNF